MKRKVQKQKQKQRLPVKQQRQSSKEQKQRQSSKEQEQRQSVNVVVNLAEKKQMKKRVYKRKTKKSPTEVEQESQSQMFRQLPPVVYMTPPQVSNYLIPPEKTPERPSITDIKTIPKPREKEEPKTMSFIEPVPLFDEPTRENVRKMEKKNVVPEPVTGKEEMKGLEMKEVVTIRKPKKLKQPKIVEVFESAQKADVPEPAILRMPSVKTIPSIFGGQGEEEEIRLPQYPTAFATRYVPPQEEEPAFGIPGGTFMEEGSPRSTSAREVGTPSRGRPASKYAYLASASKITLQDIYKEEFGEDAPSNFTVIQLREAIRKKLGETKAK